MRTKHERASNFYYSIKYTNNTEFIRRTAGIVRIGAAYTKKKKHSALSLVIIKKFAEFFNGRIYKFFLKFGGFPDDTTLHPPQFCLYYSVILCCLIVTVHFFPVTFNLIFRMDVML